MGDQNNGQGVLNIIHQQKVYTESRLVSTTGDFGTSHSAGTIDNLVPGLSDGPHTQNIWLTIGNAGSRVFIDSKPIVAEGDMDSCGHTRIGGSDKLMIG